MTLVDAGPLIAIINRKDDDHRSCVEVLCELQSPLVTTWAAVTEAMYFAGDRIGWEAQERLWRMIMRGDLVVHEIGEQDVRRMHDLMKKYRDLPMDLADATLVVLAERLGVTRIFTLDRDFKSYRLHGRKSFDIVP